MPRREITFVRYPKIDYYKYDHDQLIADLGLFGLSGKGIGEKVGMSPSRVYNRLKRWGIRLKDYRDGSWVTEMILAKIKNDRTFHTEVQHQVEAGLKEWKKQRKRMLNAA